MTNTAGGKRKFLGYMTALVTATTLPVRISFAQTNDARRPTVQPAPDSISTWMDDWMETRGTGDPLVVQRFVEPIYFLVNPIQWRPEDKSSKLTEIIVPAGFVTDFASIPSIFWSVLRPDGDYAYAAVVHDYLYWEQSLSRKESDEVLRLAMYDLDVATAKSTAIITAVRAFGQSAWNKNAELKKKGERRILRRFPTAASARWKDWKAKPDVF